MPRPQRCRKICSEPKYICFSPDNTAVDKIAVLSIDEYEIIRLVDYEKLTHEECARRMGISRTTVTETYEEARYKIADSIINGKRLRIEGGNYRICRGKTDCFCGGRCKRASK